MSEQTPGGENDVVTILKKIQQQLVYLERKLDTLIAAGGRPQSQPPFRKPFRPYGQRPEHRPGQHSEHRPARPSEHTKKPFYAGRRGHR